MDESGIGKTTVSLSEEPRKWAEQTLKELGSGLYEREDAVSATLLAVMSGQSVFLYGPPGTAKSLIARRISCIFRGAGYFEYLMQKFSTPEDVFGPVSISELKNDRYVRNTEHYLPSADIAFLDEIWKSSPAILNTLLTIINERKFKNGSQLIDVPLKAVIAASNEIPAPGSGLDALYDRFISRIKVDPVSDDGSFLSVISDNSVSGSVEVSSPITSGEWAEFISRINSVQLSEDTAELILGIRADIKELSASDDASPIYVSDRRWQKAVFLVKTAALLSGRTEAQPVDVLALKDCLWSLPDDRLRIHSIVTSRLEQFYESEIKDFRDWQVQFAKIDKEVRDLFRRSKASSAEPVVVNEVACYEMEAAIGPNGMSVRVYVPFGPKRVGGIYNAYSADGTRDGSFGVSYMFQVTESNDDFATIKFLRYSDREYKVPITFGGTGGVSSGVRGTYERSVANMRSDLTRLAVILRESLDSSASELNGPFVQTADRKRFASFIHDLSSELDGGLDSCDSLLKYMGEHDA
ncbi:MAG: AAA family ATPase [Candidatus Methanomethylophilus sp.]|nr:AAA family ATPase [Methanomethylophilus sp.]